MKQRHKDEKQENFPVGMMIFSKEKREIIMDYYKFARYADDIADNPKLKPEKKIEQLKELEKIFLHSQSYKGKKLGFVTKLRKGFNDFQLSTNLATDLLVAFERDAKSMEYKTWAQLLDYCKYSAAPVGRFMLAINNENPSTYLPADILCAVLQIVNHIQDIKYDYKLLKRVYIPTEMMKEFGVKKADLSKNATTENLKKLITNMLDTVKRQIKDAEVLPQIIKSKSLRLEVCIILFLTNIMIKKMLKKDVLASEIKLSKLDWIRAVSYGVFRGLTIRRKTLTQ